MLQQDLGRLFAYPYCLHFIFTACFLVRCDKKDQTVSMVSTLMTMYVNITHLFNVLMVSSVVLVNGSDSMLKALKQPGSLQCFIDDQHCLQYNITLHACTLCLQLDAVFP